MLQFEMRKLKILIHVHIFEWIFDFLKLFYHEIKGKNSYKG